LLTTYLPTIYLSAIGLLGTDAILSTASPITPRYSSTIAGLSCRWIALR